MNVSFIKQMKNLEREVLLKSVELDDDGDDFQFELADFSTEEEIIAVAPKCVRCNTCVEECPVNAIEPANIFRIAKITDKCVKCEICVQTCPISAIKLIDNSVIYDNGEERDVIEYNLSNVRSPHRVVRMNNISIDYSIDNNWDDCANLCPTNAFKNQRMNLAYCYGCGMCANYCENNAFDMNTGSVDLNINGKDVNIPIICRQSDRLRANKLSLKLKKMIKDGEFKL